MLYEENRRWDELSDLWKGGESMMSERKKKRLKEKEQDGFGVAMSRK